MEIPPYATNPRAAVDAGFRSRWAYEEEPDLDAVRDDARFQALLARL